MNTFAARLEHGRVVEMAIARWLMARGNAVMPAYEIEIPAGKGPQLFMLGEDLVLPDLLTFNTRKPDIVWVEAKHKSVFSWHRTSRKWTTGIDLRHYEHYQRVGEVTRLPVWLMFYHRASTPWEGDLRHGCPSECPTGLFGNTIEALAGLESHRCLPRNEDRGGAKGHGRSGMVYWPHDALKRLATVDEFTTALRGAA